MKFLGVFLFNIIFFSSSLHAEGLTRCYNAIQNHIRDAIAHNESVAPIYSKLSNGRTLPFSWALIASEKIALFTIKDIERESHVYQEAGIPILCDDLMSMHDLPPFQTSLPEKLRPKALYSFDSGESSDRIESALKEKNYESAYREIAKALTEIEAYPNQLCMTRHLLESMARSLFLANRRREEARARSLPDPMPLIEKYVHLQRRSLGLAHFIDRRAFSLQKEGIALFCQDVPAIPWK